MPLLLLAVTALFDRLHRARVERLMKRSAPTLDPVALEDPPHARGPLVLQYLDVAKVGPVHGVASRALIGAADATRRFRTALSAAALVYMAVLAGAVVSATVPLPRAGNGIAIAVYCLHGPPLCLLLWNVVDSVRLRLLVLAAYVGVGAALVLLASTPATAAVLLRVFADTFFVMPMAGLLFLLARRLRPILVGLSALVLFVAINMGFAAGVYPLLGVDLDQIPSVNRWIWRSGPPAYCSPSSSRAGCCGAPPCAGRSRDLSGWHWLGSSWAGWPRPLGLTSCWSRCRLYVLQMYVPWLLFKTIVRLQESRYLPAQVLQFHLCWGFLTVDHQILFYYGTGLFARSASGLPLAGFRPVRGRPAPASAPPVERGAREPRTATAVPSHLRRRRAARANTRLAGRHVAPPGPDRPDRGNGSRDAHAGLADA